VTPQKNKKKEHNESEVELRRRLALLRHRNLKTDTKSKRRSINRNKGSFPTLDFTPKISYSGSGVKGKWSRKDEGGVHESGIKMKVC